MDQTKLVKLAKWVGKKGGPDDTCVALDVRVLADRLAFCTPPSSPDSVTLDPYPEAQGGKGGAPEEGTMYGSAVMAETS